LVIPSILLASFNVCDQVATVTLASRPHARLLPLVRISTVGKLPSKYPFPLKLIHSATTKLSCLCRVCFDGVNWIPDNSRLADRKCEV